MTAGGWHDLIPAQDLPVDAQRIVQIGPHDVLLCHTGEGFFAVQAECSHARQSLAGGRVRKGTIMCPVHGARFDLKTGESLSPITREGLRTFEIEVREGRVFGRDLQESA